jgi:hypothetical protein
VAPIGWLSFPLESIDVQELLRDSFASSKALAACIELSAAWVRATTAAGSPPTHEKHRSVPDLAVVARRLLAIARELNDATSSLVEAKPDSSEVQ